jgi:hypothetical protein
MRRQVRAVVAMIEPIRRLTLAKRLAGAKRNHATSLFRPTRRVDCGPAGVAYNKLSVVKKVEKAAGEVLRP